MLLLPRALLHYCAHCTAGAPNGVLYMRVVDAASGTASTYINFTKTSFQDNQVLKTRLACKRFDLVDATASSNDGEGVECVAGGGKANEHEVCGSWALLFKLCFRSCIRLQVF